MISKELIRKVRKIEIKSNRIVEEVFSGEYHSVFKGNGMEFEDIREYSPGDDVRSIDWNVTARHDKAYMKMYKEERELNIFLLIDASNSNNFGAKRDKIAEIGATLALSAVKNNDKVGALLFTDRVEKVIPSKKGKRHVLSIIETILNYTPHSKSTDLEEALRFFTNFEKKRSIVFVVSDFLNEGYEKKLKILSRKHDIVLIRVFDKAENSLPGGAIFVFEDLETGEEIVVDNLSEDRTLDFNLKIPSKSLINIATEEDFVKPLRIFFRRRARR